MNYNASSVTPNSITGMLPTPAVGYRFHPTNEQLITNYLKPKMLGDDLEDLHFIAEVNLRKHEPWDLPVKSNIKSDDSVWYFFCPRDFMNLKSRRSNRRTKEGFWKPTGKNVKIKARRTKKQIGTKKTLVFYKKATPKNVRTDWIIHEYECTFVSNQSNQGEYVLCKLKNKSGKKSNRGEENHHTPSVSDFEAEPSCNMTSDFECQNRSEMTVNSACNESEASHNVACDIEYQNSNELVANSSSQLMTSDFENHYPNELMSNSACDGSGSLCSMSSGVENQYSNYLIAVSACDGSGLHHSMAPGFENQYSNNIIAVSAFDGSGLHHSVAPGFENQYSNNIIAVSACDGSGLHHSVAPGFENQYSNNIIAVSACNGSRLHHSMAAGFDFENQYSNNLLAISACDGSGLHHFMAAGFENHYSNDFLAISACDGSGLPHSVAVGFENHYSNELMSDSACDGSGSHHSVAFDFENQYSIGLKVNSPCENWIMASDFEDQVSSPQLNSECGPSVEMPPKFICQLTCDKGETSCLVADDFEIQNHDKEFNISASGEGASNPLMTAPSDLENQNPLEKTDMFTLEDFFVSYSTASFSENIAADSALTEVSPQQLAELEAFFELEDSLNSASQPSDMGSGASISS